MNVDPAAPSALASWRRWLVGALVLIGVVSVTLHFTESSELLTLARDAQTARLGLAAVLQCGTYALEGALWRGITCRAGCPLTFLQSMQLSIGKFFVDQAIPTGGVSGSIMAASALNRRGVSRSVVAAAVVVERVAFLVAYALALTAAMSMWRGMGGSNQYVFTAGAAFASCSAVVAAGMLMIGGGRWQPPRWTTRVKPVHDLLHWVRQGDAQIIRNTRNLGYATALQLGVVALDACTMLLVVQSLNARVDVGGVFVSFMVSSLFRTLSLVPGGLGTFEASSTMTLRLAGADTAIAVSATLLFRGLSYWLPMLPGFWCARRLTTRTARRRAEDVAAESTAR